jgi:hypothetical protein
LLNVLCGDANEMITERTQEESRREAGQSESVNPVKRFDGSQEKQHDYLNGDTYVKARQVVTVSPPEHLK